MDLWKSCKDKVLTACDKLYGKTLVRRDRGNTWWWNEEVKDAKAYKELCKIESEENKLKYRKTRNETKKAVARATRREAEKEMKELCKKPHNVFKLSKLLKREGKDVEGKRCIRRKDGKLGFNENAHRNIWNRL